MASMAVRCRWRGRSCMFIEIFKDLRKAPLLVHVYSDGDGNGLTARGEAENGEGGAGELADDDNGIGNGNAGKPEGGGKRDVYWGVCGQFGIQGFRFCRAYGNNYGRRGGTRERVETTMDREP
ncbi:hypothetical protein ACOSQ2_017711 [Xanthoceras sorbifolium]